jgi:putative membrane protein
MSNRPYSRLNKEKLILRDYLAADRTVLANERTFLAYVRTALTLFAAGVTFIHFFQPLVLQIIGWILMPLGVISLIIGLIRYRKMQTQIRDEMEEASPGAPHTE